MTNYDQAWAVGGTFTLVAVLLIVSLMRESIPYGVRRAAQVIAFLGVVGFAAFAAMQRSPGMRGISWAWPTLNAAPVETLKADAPAEKSKAAKPAREWHDAPNLNRRLKVGTMREVTPEEAQRLMRH